MSENEHLDGRLNGKINQYAIMYNNLRALSVLQKATSKIRI